MTLNAQDMRRLEDNARTIARASITYLAEIQRCLFDTRDPIDALALLRAMWGSSHARRDNQKAALADAGRWLEERIRRTPEISIDLLTLELGWLRRLVSVHGSPDDDRGDDERGRARRTGADSAPFGTHVDLLGTRRKVALAAVAKPLPPNGRAGELATPSPAPGPTHLPDVFEARLANWQEAIDAFKNIRKRRKQKKPLRDRLLDVTPVAAELQPLATDLACSVVHTEGMNQLVDVAGDLPTFFIAVADLAPRDGKRVPSRISLAAAGSRAR